MLAAEVDFEAFEAVVRSRRSIRIFRDEPIPEATMQRCLDLALLAPNSSNLRTWEFFWVRTPEIRHQLNEACLSQPAVETAAELVFIIARPDKWNESRRRILNHLETQERVPDSYRNYYQKIVPVFYSQGFGSWFGWCKRIGLAIRGLFKPTPREPVHHHQMETWSVKSAALAAQNLMLALRARVLTRVLSKASIHAESKKYSDFRIERSLSWRSRLGNETRSGFMALD